VVARTGELAPRADVAATSLAWYDELRLAPVLAGGFRSAGLDEAASWTAADTVRMLLALTRPSQIKGRGPARDARLFERWLARPVVREAMGVNTWDGVEWLERDRFLDVVAWAARLDALASGEATDDAFVQRLVIAADAAEYRVDRLAPQARAQPAVRSSEAGDPRSRTCRARARRR
jgi:hypothetical protein